MTHAKLDPLDDLELSVRARRGELGADEQEKLARALDQSATLRIAHLTGQSFDAAGVVRSGDEALVARAARAATSAKNGKWRRRGQRVTLGLAAALVVGSAAAATVIVVRQRRALELEHAHASIAAKPAPSTAKRDVAKERHADISDAPSADALPPVEPSVREQAPSASTAKPAKSASELFADASAARRTGDFVAARALYAELQARFPGTNEARVSTVSLAKLLLAAGKAREAERAFKAYLETGGGNLAEEALVGRANALQALGDVGEEYRAWQELLRTYPASVYRARAEARRAALDATRSARPE
jgi:tetratricopeptide (TPR) repeat protein